MWLGVNFCLLFVFLMRIRSSAGSYYHVWRCADLNKAKKI